ncbi:septum formation initiator family protein [Aerococcus sp. 1KP-2016]|jgi:cell division protein DivIC|uniref:FtsB family cell division protein n=1 Tax=Aerococcus sp. 1KP-2016 TaxID=1981982 RepID=UPI000B98EF53|nr:septum formation initiator family protein [Aerococcus sp. 1KP-2016]OYQ68064.1 septum formation initiator [Aerococcus sp. 1KP-2016]
MRETSRPDSENKNITSLEDHRKAKGKKKAKAKRLSFGSKVMRSFIAVFAVVIAFCVYGIYDANQEQQALQEQIALTQDEITGEQKAIDTLAQQATLLKDDEYVAKLARSRYYLSKEGEIIFSVPEDNASKQAEILNKAYLQQDTKTDSE